MLLCESNNLMSFYNLLEVKEGLPWAKLITKRVTSDEEEQRFPVFKETCTIGRKPGSDVLVPDSRVSGTHCIILRRGKNGGPALKDTSTNGTLINGKRVDKNAEVELADMDCISIVQRKEDSEQNIAYRFVDLRESDEVEATVNYEQDNTLEVNLREDVAEGGREGARGDDEEEKGEEGDLERKKRKRKLEDMGVPVATKLRILASDVSNVVHGPGVTEGSTSTAEKGIAVPTLVANNSIEETLICQICQEIMHACVSLQPCMHSYCGGCYSDWMAESRTCPACRKKVRRISKNHIINSLIEAYLRANPSRKRPEEDLQELDARNKITHDMEYSYMRRCFGQPVHNDESDSDSDSFSEHSTGTSPSPLAFSSVRPLSLLSFCLQCPGNAGMLSSPPSSLHPFTCSSVTRHTPCQCCLRSMPVRDDDSSIVQQCEHCKHFYCHQYWGCTKPSCLGCITQFKDMRLHSTCLNGILGNAYESNILKCYLESKNLSSHPLLTPDTYICQQCGLRALKNLAYHYRKTIPKEDLPEAVSRRENCYWGKECRTQFKSPAHAMRFNHMCERIRQL